MTESSITHFGDGGVVMAGPDATRLFAAITLSAAIGLLAKGITPTRGLTSKRAFAMAKTYTGQDYRRSEHERAREDLKVWIETMKSAIPTTVES